MKVQGTATMNYLQTLKSKLAAARSAKAGFTMIELLIVITILGILATAVLSAINPIEQINRGRDTGSVSDAEQLISGIDRFYAFQGHYPWFKAPPATDTPLPWRPMITGTAFTDGASFTGTSSGDCPVWEKLSQAETTGCTGTDELKSTFFNRIQKATGYNTLYVFNGGSTGNSTYVCFVPQSAAFEADAKERCVDGAGSGLPSDIDSTTAGTICAGTASGSTDPVYYCLP